MVCFWYGYGYHRNLRVRTRTCPTRRSSDLGRACRRRHSCDRRPARRADGALRVGQDSRPWHPRGDRGDPLWPEPPVAQGRDPQRSEEHTSELQSLMRISYAGFCLKQKNTHRKLTATFVNSSTKNDTTTSI